MLRMLLTILLPAWCLTSAAAQEPDSTGRAPDGAGQADSSEIQPSDDTTPASLEDSIKIAFPSVELDTLNNAQRMLVEFETRLYFSRLETKPAVVSAVGGLSYQDSLIQYFVTPRWNLRNDIDRAFFHDAGDYFRFDPGFLVLEPQATPMRKTVQPYGLPGDRLGILVGGKPYAPFEHVVEPDGLRDLADVPTALDDLVAILPGPVGMVFGADHSAASLLTVPSPHDTTGPRSSMIVDKGAYAYAYTRGRYARRFTSGRQINLSIGYRSADGAADYRSDDAYQYTGDLSLPLGLSWGLRAEGLLYDRSGDYRVRPDAGGGRIERDRIDRSAQVTFRRRGPESTSRYEFAYRYLRQGSSLEGSYRANLNNLGHGISLSREWIWGRTAWRMRLDGDWLRYDDWFARYERYSGAGSLELASLTAPWRLAVRLRQQYVEGYRFLPLAAAMISRDSKWLYLLLSVGYSERAPSLYELHLRPQSAGLYGTGEDYADGGYEDLESEKQVFGTAEVQLGTVATNLGVSVTGGRIDDGIDWRARLQGGKTIFSPCNEDLDFATATAHSRLALADILSLLAGASYHYTYFEDDNSRPFDPEYQAFAGGELHWYWESRLIHFYAYGEVAYVGPYEGYVDEHLGDQPVFNAKLSFALRKFRFHWVVQNMFLVEKRARDQFNDAVRFTYFGFTWDFLD